MLVLNDKMKLVWSIWVDDEPVECCILYADGSIGRGNPRTYSDSQFQIIKQAGAA